MYVSVCTASRRIGVFTANKLGVFACAFSFKYSFPLSQYGSVVAQERTEGEESGMPSLGINSYGEGSPFSIGFQFDACVDECFNGEGF